LAQNRLKPVVLNPPLPLILLQGLDGLKSVISTNRFSFIQRFLIFITPSTTNTTPTMLATTIITTTNTTTNTTTPAFFSALTTTQPPEKGRDHQGQHTSTQITAKIHRSPSPEDQILSTSFWTVDLLMALKMREGGGC